MNDWQHMLNTPVAMAAIGYLLGSIPFGVILTRLGNAGDLRSIGSGNIGATNVLRTGRKGLAAATLLFDLAKGAVAVLVAMLVAPALVTVAGAAAVIGHLYPVWLRFRGGKGVATLMGVVLALDWRAGLIYAALWIATIAVTRISSLGGLVAAVSVPVAFWLLGHASWIIFGALMAVLVLWRHRDNIARLMAGTEPRIGGAKPTA